MGIFVGIVEILLGLWELWSGAKVNRLFGWKTKEYYTRFFAYAGCGCVSILVCVLSGFWDSRLDAFTFFAEMGVLILYGEFRQIYRLHSCNMEVNGVFSHFSPTIGIMPVFTYQVGKKQYRQTSQLCNMEKYRSQLKAGETYTIFVSAKNPAVFALTRKIEISSCFIIPVGVLLLVPLLMYCGELLTK